MPGFPRADSFLYCFTLKVGAHILCAYDQISSWLEAGLMLFVLFNRETFFKAQEGSKRSDAVLWTGEPAAAGMGGVLAYAMIAVITAVFAGAAGEFCSLISEMFLSNLQIVGELRSSGESKPFVHEFATLCMFPPSLFGTDGCHT